MRKAKYCIEIRLYYDNIFQGWNTEEQGNIPSKGGSQLTLASVWESKKMMTSAVATLAPANLAVIRPDLSCKII